MCMRKVLCEPLPVERRTCVRISSVSHSDSDFAFTVVEPTPVANWDVSTVVFSIVFVDVLQNKHTFFDRLLMLLYGYPLGTSECFYCY